MFHSNLYQYVDISPSQGVGNINYTVHKTRVKRLGNVLKEELIAPPIRRIMTVFELLI